MTTNTTSIFKHPQIVLISLLVCINFFCLKHAVTSMAVYVPGLSDEMTDRSRCENAIEQHAPIATRYSA